MNGEAAVRPRVKRCSARNLCEEGERLQRACEQARYDFNQGGGSQEALSAAHLASREHYTACKRAKSAALRKRVLVSPIRYALIEVGIVLPGRYRTREEAQGAADHANAEAEDAMGEELLGDGTCSVVAVDADGRIVEAQS